MSEVMLGGLGRAIAPQSGQPSRKILLPAGSLIDLSGIFNSRHTQEDLFGLHRLVVIACVLPVSSECERYLILSGFVSERVFFVFDERCALERCCVVKRFEAKFPECRIAL